MKVSVIIPSYRPGNYVYECLDSLMNQSLDALRFEVIVVLNGTRDPYGSSCRDMRSGTVISACCTKRLQGYRMLATSA